MNGPVSGAGGLLGWMPCPRKGRNTFRRRRCTPQPPCMREVRQTRRPTEALERHRSDHFTGACVIDLTARVWTEDRVGPPLLCDVALPVVRRSLNQELEAGRRRCI